MMDDEQQIHHNKLPGKTYISPRIYIDAHEAVRIASKVIDSDGLHYATVKKEIVLRRTEKGRTEIVAKFIESTRDLRVLTIQAFNGQTGTPHKTHFSFVGEEIPKLLAFFENIASVEFASQDKINITDTELRRLVLSKEQAASLVHDNQDIFSEVVRQAITREDVVALGYRKRQVATFARLLKEPTYFDQVKVAKGVKGDEALWQAFFERNRWIFGYGLSYFFVTGFDNKKLEQVVEGHDLINRGKRADGLMKTKGVVSSLCFVEIKTHATKLLDSTQYRSGCWAPSKELSGAVAQVQATVASAMRSLSEYIQPTDTLGVPTGEEVFNFKPRAFVVVGSLNEFVTEHGVNRDQLRSFELYRNSISSIDILTFDELFERCSFIVQSEAERTSGETSTHGTESRT
ncbi:MULTISPECIES: Shedu immune nuclease family protein [unclassified Burkholderia]|uniref:Shedu immune nuclease family protein n=1 Tax=unclassified Burkholderia TaxID=2613784 RepID=UPI001F04F7CD|nr:MULTISPECIES: Shedu immune nuclease family protein [unclassified Burkholderia]